jgi:hypothetical protein
MPAKAGSQNYLKTLDYRLRGNDAKGRFKAFYETINFRLRTLYIPGKIYESFRTQRVSRS